MGVASSCGLGMGCRCGSSCGEGMCGCGCGCGQQLQRRDVWAHVQAFEGFLLASFTRSVL